ncbi:MAG: hypothetical protein Q9202_007453 [Teloschistes flavicans]
MPDSGLFRFFKGMGQAKKKNHEVKATTTIGSPQTNYYSKGEIPEYSKRSSTFSKSRETAPTDNDDNDAIRKRSRDVSTGGQPRSKSFTPERLGRNRHSTSTSFDSRPQSFAEEKLSPEDEEQIHKHAYQEWEDTTKANRGLRVKAKRGRLTEDELADQDFFMGEAEARLRRQCREKKRGREGSTRY